MRLNQREKIKLAKKEYKKFKFGDPIFVGKKLIGYVSEVHNKWWTGENSYVITNKQLPKHPTSKDYKNVDRVTVLYRGSTTLIDWANNIDFGFAAFNPIINSTGIFYNNLIPPQFRSSYETLNNAMNKYGNARFEVYGHSLGSMDGQFAVANLSEKQMKRLSGAYLYEGPNIFSSLSLGQMMNVFKHKSKIFNIIDSKDIVVFGYFNDLLAVGTVMHINSKSMHDVISQHMWGGYQYDKNGNIKLVPENQLQIGMLNLNLLKDKLSKGGLSKSDKIYLDSAAAVILADNIKTYVDESMDSLIKDLNGYISEAEDLWKDTKRRARGMGQDLSEDDIMNTLRQVNATKSEFVTKVIEYYQDKIKKAEQVKSDYSDISTNIKKGVQAKLETDQELARSFNLL
ncbi:lipase family protein [Companilactobacillus sp. DQM5]|uniref:lipase family protein n=1 Tax=Companilactobacillus sp. DQM5 TaxID=3463359 RepID=UPI0040592050